MVRLVILRTLESYFRHRWLYILPVVLMMIAASVYLLLSKPTYIAKGVIFVQSESFLASLTSVRDSGYSWQTPAQTATNEFEELIQTDAFVRSMVSTTDLESEMLKDSTEVKELFEEIRKSVWLEPLGDSQIRVNAEYEEPIIAQQLVNGSIETYIQWKINSDMSESQAAQSFFTDLVGIYKEDLDLARENMNIYLVSHPVPLREDRPDTEKLEIERLQAEVDLAASRYANALDKDEEARLATAQAENDVRQNYVLVDAPTIPEKPGTSLKDTVISIAIFIILGIMLSFIAIVGGALLDRSLLFPIDVHYGLHLAVLTEIPDNTSPKSSKLRRKRKREAMQHVGADFQEEKISDELSRDDDMVNFAANGHHTVIEIGQKVAQEPNGKYAEREAELTK